VSFLSTSVRSSPTPNLLAQPLNDLLRALRTHLNLTEQHDSYQQAQISTQRTERNADMATAALGLTGAAQTTRAHRASLALGIKNTLRQVALASAAALAADGDRPLVLILDELGRNLGKQHRRDPGDQLMDFG
jgi:hypothetical protein